MSYVISNTPPNELTDAELSNEMAEKVHEWAAKDEAGWEAQFALSKTGEKEDD